MTSLQRSLMAFVILLSAFVGNIVLRFGINEPPSATGDEPSYDSIAWELSHGRGFAEDFDNPEFRQPYDEAAVTQGALMTLPISQPGTVTHRPPLFPSLLAVFDLLFGRQFFAARLFNCCLMAATGAVLFSVVERRHGLWTAILSTLVFVAIDSRTRLYSRAVLTESLAVFLTMSLTLLLWRLNRSLNLRTASNAGLILGLTILTRSISVLWIPGLCLTLFSQMKSKVIRPLICLIFTTCLIISPWAIRNCWVLNSFMPLGAQGMMELPAGFSDEALRRGGVWFPLDQIQFFPPTENGSAENGAAKNGVEVSGDSDSPKNSNKRSDRLQRERSRAEFGRQAAFDWIGANPVAAIKLAGMKVWSEYRPRSQSEVLILILVLAGAIRTISESDCQTILGLHVANAMSIAMTWSVEGRFVVPMLFGLHYLAAGGIGLALRIGRQAADRIKRRSDDRSQQ